MPWQGVTVEEQRENFIRDWKLDHWSVSELAERFCISRKTAYKWINRFCDTGKQGYKERSRRPHTSPNATPQYIVNELKSRRGKRGCRGAKKLVDSISRAHPQWPMPSIATANRILDRAGLVEKRRRTRRTHPGCPKTTASAPNEIWAIDYKGQFKLGDGTYCYPLTVSDLDTRFILGCEAHGSPNHAQTKSYLEQLFRRYGLPLRMRSDNGVPFATNALARLSMLSVWLIRLGIYPELIEPGKPQQNGIHERMHKTLKHEATIPPSRSMAAQQKRFDAFLKDFNFERGHEALAMKRPAEVYTPSPRVFPEVLPEYNYPEHNLVRKVSRAGTVRLFTTQFFVATPLREQRIGFEEIDDGLYDVYFCFYLIGRYDSHKGKLSDVISRVPVSRAHLGRDA
jgi:transposase InsO family protein